MKIFRGRIPYKLQTPKIAYIWPIENVWAIENQDLDVKVFNIAKLRTGIRLEHPGAETPTTRLCVTISSAPYQRG